MQSTNIRLRSMQGKSMRKQKHEKLSMFGESMGRLNVSRLGYGDCARFFRRYDIPLLLFLGGGTPVNVARCWAYEKMSASCNIGPTSLRASLSVFMNVASSI